MTGSPMIIKAKVKLVTFVMIQSKVKDIFYLFFLLGV